MMIAPFFLFWILIAVCFRDLGRRSACVFILLWFALFVGFQYLGISPYWFVAAQALIDIILILRIFGGDIRIR